MSFFPLRKIPGVSWPEVPPGNVSQLWTMYLDLERSQWLSAEEIAAGQLAQLRELLRHCSQHVPYYQESLRKADVRPDDIKTMKDLRGLPLLQRRTYQEQFQDFHARALPVGMVKTSEGSTSGTGGIPIKVWRTNLVHLWWLACYLRDLQWCQLDPRGVLASIRSVGVDKTRLEEAMRGMVFPCWSALLEPLLQTGPAHVMDIQQEPAMQLRWLLQVQPTYLLSAPSNVVLLARLFQTNGSRLTELRAIQLIAETVTEADQRCIESAFGVPVKNLYSCMEAGYVASSCPEGHGLHVHAENVLLEVLNDRDEPCGPGETGRVVLTTLQNFVTPFVRYEILDSATPGPERCPCGRGLPLLTCIEGKIRPMFYLSGGRRKASHMLVQQFSGLQVYHQHQIVQRRLDHVLVRLVPNANWTEASRDRVVECIQQYFEAPVRVDVELRERLPLTAGGKLRDIVIEMEADNAS